MTSRRGRLRAPAARPGVCLWLSLLLLWPALCAAAAPLTAKERRGKDLYLRGASGEDAGAKAWLRGPDLEVPAAVMPCSNCHGRDGRGRTEGIVAAPDVTWAQLTRRASHTHAGGRTHGPHSVLTIGSAIARGVDPDGQGLDASMPVYRFSPAALDALLAYLQRLGDERDPGLAPQRIVIGTVAPAGHPGAREAQAVWRAFFDDVNAAGGVHGRRLELRVAEAAPREGAAGIATAARGLLGDDGAFALLGVFVAEPADDLAALVAEHEAPLVAPLTPFPRRRTPLERQVFYVAPGVADQGRALLLALRRQPAQAHARIALLWPAEPGYASAAEELAQACERLGLPLALRRGVSREAVGGAETLAAVRAAQSEAVLLLGARGEEVALLGAADAAGFRPQVLLPAYAGGAAVLELPVGFHGRVLVGLALPPVSVARVTDAQARRLFAPAAAAPSLRPSPTALFAFRAARLLVEALRAAGRDVTRDGLTTALEGLYDFDLGVGPHVSFGPNRRDGSPGAHVVTLDLKRRVFTPLAEWTAAED